VNARPGAVALAALTAVLLAPPAPAKLVGGVVEHRTAADPAAEVARLAGTGGATWLAWSVPAGGGDTICGFGRGTAAWGMTLDEGTSSWGTRDGAPAIAVTAVEIYAAVRDGRVRQLQFASEGCPVQAGNRRVLWLDGVTPAASVELLAGLAARRGAAGSDDELAERALAGLAFHADPAAPLALVHLGREGASTELRAQSLFWLAQTDAPQAARWIREAIARDPASEVREQAVFALSQLPDGAPQLLALLRESSDRDAKRQAIFWLGQSDDPQATAELERLLTR
jgi:hypothetical protein